MLFKNDINQLSIMLFYITLLPTENFIYYENWYSKRNSKR